MPPNTWYVDNPTISFSNLVPGYKNKTPTKPNQQQLKMILEKAQSQGWSRGAVQVLTPVGGWEWRNELQNQEPLFQSWFVYCFFLNSSLKRTRKRTTFKTCLNPYTTSFFCCIVPVTSRYLLQFKVVQVSLWQGLDNFQLHHDAALWSLLQVLNSFEYRANVATRSGRGWSCFNKGFPERLSGRMWVSGHSWSEPFYLSIPGVWRPRLMPVSTEHPLMGSLVLNCA